ncbi:MAG: hypothetical protein ACOYYU_15700 [Chloroflexota bacterium]
MNDQGLPSNANAPLGAFRNSFLPRKDPGKAMLLAAIVSFIACAFAAYSAVERALRPATEGLFGERMQRDAILVNAIISIVLLLTALLLLGLRYTHSKARVDLYENGVVVFDWRKQTTVLWDDLWKVDKEPIYGSGRRVVNWTYTLTLVNGQKVRFRGLDGLGVLGKAVEKHAA